MGAIISVSVGETGEHWCGRSEIFFLPHRPGKERLFQREALEALGTKPAGAGRGLALKGGPPLRLVSPSSSRFSTGTCNSMVRTTIGAQPLLTGGHHHCPHFQIRELRHREVAPKVKYTVLVGRAGFKGIWLEVHLLRCVLRALSHRIRECSGLLPLYRQGVR